MLEHLDIKFIELGEEFIKASMPVDHRTIQPLKLLHGGASVVLAETLGSIAGMLCVDIQNQYCVGLEINANHIKTAKLGEKVFGTVRPIHVGRKTQVWSIEITNEKDQLLSISRLTNSVMDKK